VKSENAIGEVDPDYIYFEESLTRIKAHFDLSRLKFIFIFRNPVDRAFSHYLMTFRRGLETKTFPETIVLEPERISADFFSKMHYSYVDRGFYYRQLLPFLEVLQPEQMLFLLSDDLQQDKNSVLNKCFNFLGVDSKISEIKTSINHHAAKIPRSDFLLNEIVRRQDTLIKKIFRILIFNKMLRHKFRSKILDANLRDNDGKLSLQKKERLQLVEIYRDENRKLSKLLHRDLDHWNRVD
jgi:hypothetical protein